MNFPPANHHFLAFKFDDADSSEISKFTDETEIVSQPTLYSSESITPSLVGLYSAETIVPTWLVLTLLRLSSLLGWSLLC